MPTESSRIPNRTRSLIRPRRQAPCPNNFTTLRNLGDEAARSNPVALLRADLADAALTSDLQRGWRAIVPALSIGGHDSGTRKFC
jgi:hypothetical protein